MSVQADSILAGLNVVAAVRAHRSGVPGLDAKVVALKEFQQRRFAHTYADLLRSPRHGPAARFFLDELYGPNDFTRRDAEFAKVIPGLVKLFPEGLVATVADVAKLHALSETLDTAMATHLRDAGLGAIDYARAWQSVGRACDRQEQIALMVSVAGRLDRFTRKPLLRRGLHLMRGPARAAGLAELHRFLEAGFDTFRAMGGAREFIAIVQSREEALAASLFTANLADEGNAWRAIATLLQPAAPIEDGVA
ncbi:MAG: hypothetical protein ABI641_04950 [Caldimonas sp.]